MNPTTSILSSLAADVADARETYIAARDALTVHATDCATPWACRTLDYLGAQSEQANTRLAMLNAMRMQMGRCSREDRQASYRCP